MLLSLLSTPARLLSPAGGLSTFDLLLAVAVVALASIIAWMNHRAKRSLELGDTPDALALLEAMETIASAPVEEQALAEAVHLAVGRVFDFDAIQFGFFEGSKFTNQVRVARGHQLEPIRQTVGLEQNDLASWCLRHKVPHLLSHGSPVGESNDQPQLEGQTLLTEGDLLVVPIHGPVHPLGVLILESVQPGAFGEVHIQLAERLAAAMAPVMSRVRIQSEIESRSTQMVLLSEISRRLISLQPLDERFQQVVEVISQAFEFAQVRLYECVGEVAVLRAASHPKSNEPTSIAFGFGLVGLAARQEKTIELKEISTRGFVDPLTQSSEDNALAVPLLVENRVLGVLHLSSTGSRLFSQTQVAFAELLASILAIATLEARNYAQQQEYTWINTVLLEVARHAAQPGDPEDALRAVLQLTTLLAGANWTILLLPDETGDLVHLGPSSGVNRASLERIADLTLQPDDFGIGPPYQEADEPAQVELPYVFQEILGEPSALVFGLTDSEHLLGLLLMGGPIPTGTRRSLIAGIAHQISLRIENTRLIEELATQRTVERELAMARNIQRSFLPENLPEVPGWQLGATWVAARKVGGDFYDFIPLSTADRGPRWGVAIADVADKGVPAALFMALCRTLLRSVATSEPDPGATLTRLNRLIFSETRPDLFVSVFYAVWEPAHGKVVFANGGHNPPVLYRPSGETEVIRPHGMVLGVDERAGYQTYDLTIPPGGLLLLYTDGVSEATDETGRFFGLENVRQLVQRSVVSDAQSLAQLLAGAVADFSPDPEPSDDLTTVVLYRLPEPNPHP